MAKLGWRFLNDEGSLWGRVVSGKYCKRSAEISKMVKKQSSFQAWKGSTEATELLKKRLGAKMYNGQKKHSFGETSG